MDAKTRQMIRRWVADNPAETREEDTAEYLSRVLRIGSLRACRNLVREAMLDTSPTEE